MKYFIISFALVASITALADIIESQSTLTVRFPKLPVSTCVSSESHRLWGPATDNSTYNRGDDIFSIDREQGTTKHIFKGSAEPLVDAKQCYVLNTNIKVRVKAFDIAGMKPSHVSVKCDKSEDTPRLPRNTSQSFASSKDVPPLKNDPYLIPGLSTVSTKSSGTGGSSQYDHQKDQAQTQAQVVMLEPHIPQNSYFHHKRQFQASESAVDTDKDIKDDTSMEFDRSLGSTPGRNAVSAPFQSETIPAVASTITESMSEPTFFDPEPASEKETSDLLEDDFTDTLPDDVPEDVSAPRNGSSLFCCMGGGFIFPLLGGLDSHGSGYVRRKSDATTASPSLMVVLGIAVLLL
ncbi:hypothetical protein JCM33374_g4521 [Metschnikowia sp. JCM 33374]|nr:hypothetical protein JCM33374_g4521 [Metschnikowia sp. JCM 33374]